VGQILYQKRKFNVIGRNPIKVEGEKEATDYAMIIRSNDGVAS
jgi:hypothetical protein